MVWKSSLARGSAVWENGGMDGAGALAAPQTWTTPSTAGAPPEVLQESAGTFKVPRVVQHTLSAAAVLPLGVVFADKFLASLHSAPPQHQPGALSLHALGILGASLQQGWPFPQTETPFSRSTKARQVFRQGTRAAEAGVWLWVMRNRWGDNLTGPQMSTILMALFVVKLAASTVLLWNQGADTTRLVEAFFLAFTFATLPYGIVWSYAGPVSKLKTGIVAFSATMMQDLVRALSEVVQPTPSEQYVGQAQRFLPRDVSQIRRAFLASFCTAAGPAFSLQVATLLDATAAKPFPPEAVPFIQAYWAAFTNILLSQLADFSLERFRGERGLFWDPQDQSKLAEQIRLQVAS